MSKALVVASTVLAAGALARAVGERLWATETARIQARLEEGREPLMRRCVNFGDLEGLPRPVRRYFSTVLKNGRPRVTGVRFQHRGVFNMGETRKWWVPFNSDHRVVTHRPGFHWDARIRLFRGVTVRARDAYAVGEGLLQAKFLGLVPMVRVHGKGDLAQGQLMRFLAEAAWYPTALLPGQGVRWDAIGVSSARATLEDGNVSATLVFHFHRRGWIESVSAATRPRIVKKKTIPTPWHGRFWDYEEHDGMMIPTEGEVAWVLPEGPKPYWRGRLTGIAYEYG